MATGVERFADGSWLTPRLMIFAAAISIGMTAILLGYLFFGATGTVDAMGRPLGTDFSNVWTAGRMALDGQAARAYDWNAHYAVQQATHHRDDIPFYGWHYPPIFLIVASALAMLPYVPALLLWQSVTLAAALLLARRIVPHPLTWIVALGYPAVYICLGHGHNGFLTALLLGGGMLLLDKRPWVAGCLLGLLAYKPQFALVIPAVLLAGQHWRAIAGATLAVAGACLLTVAVWGWPVWEAFLGSLDLTRTVVIEQGSTGWEKIQSPFAWVRMWGGGIGLAYGAQAFATLAVTAACAWLSRTAQPNLRNAATCIGALLSTPYILDYDMVVIGIAIAFLVRDGISHGFGRWEKTILALAWFTPLVAREVAAAAALPLGLIAMVALFAMVVTKARMAGAPGSSKGLTTALAYPAAIANSPTARRR